jgi:hypothetical protein
MPDDPQQDAATPRDPHGGATLGWVAALAVSAGLAGWLLIPDAHRPPPPVVAIKPPPRLVAGAAADAGQVRRAYESFQDAYADGGAEGLGRFVATCQETLKADPRILDDCLALDLFAAAVAPERAGPRAEAARLSLARAALPPNTDPAAHLAQVRKLMKQAVLGDRPAAPSKVAKVSLVRPGSTKAAPRRRAALVRLDPCQLEPTPADRLVCANPALASADRRMQQALDEAVASGADRAQLEQQQADWRNARNAARDADAITALYEQRTRDLEDLTPPH